MRDKLQKFLQILKIELKESEQELHFLEDLHKKREETGEITEYVFRENMNLIKNEISSVEQILSSIDDIAKLSEGSAGFNETAENLKRKIQERLKHKNHGEAVYEIVSRKIDKVLRYVQGDI